MQKSWERETKKMIMRMTGSGRGESDEEQEGTYYDVLHTPYIEGFTDKIMRELKKLNVGWVLKKKSSIKTEVHSHRPPEKMTDKKGVIYKINCGNCESSYIGETGQTLGKRLQQHQRDVREKKSTNGIYQHLRRNRKHKSRWEEVKVIDNERHWYKRKIKEAVYINAVDPSCNNGKLMNLEKGYEISTIWNAFNTRARKSIMHTQETSSAEEEYFYC